MHAPLPTPAPACGAIHWWRAAARRRWTTPALALLALAAAACSRKAQEGRGTLPEPTLQGADTSAARPAVPFIEIAPGVFQRTVFGATDPAGLAAEVRELEVGPNRETGRLALPGAAIIEVRAGDGAMTLPRQTPLRAGATVTVAQGESLAIANPGGAPLSLRVYLVTAR
ncbi:MAG: hypothetical protein IRY91_07925 [Gemmatimonadaceae bacterium]|nr:hypothetical protein [Gemmatimonadaceae bacterium]